MNRRTVTLTTQYEQEAREFALEESCNASGASVALCRFATDATRSNGGTEWDVIVHKGPDALTNAMQERGREAVFVDGEEVPL